MFYGTYNVSFSYSIVQKIEKAPFAGALGIYTSIHYFAQDLSQQPLS